MDETTKVLLAAMALGLWANAIPKATARYDAGGRGFENRRPGPRVNPMSLWRGYWL
jgi:hypothetical protein